MAIQTYDGVPLCHWCGWEVYKDTEDGEERTDWVGNDDYIAHDDCHENQT